MKSSSLVHLALSAQRCTQKELALRLGVSPAQISKWKSGEHISFEMSDKLSELADLSDLDPDVVLLAGSKEDAKKWVQLIRYLADMAEQNAETGYSTATLVEDLDDDNCLLFWNVFHVLQKMGVNIPRPFPKELEACIADDDEGEAIWDNEIASLIYDIFKSLTNVYGFYAAFVSDLVFDDELDLIDTPAWELDSELLSLAASKLDLDENKIPGFPRFKHKVESEVAGMVAYLKARAFRAGIPLRAELMDLVLDSQDELGQAAEAHSFGFDFDKDRLHPDVYMNELLTGMRVIHQVLPAIMKKLGIEDEFELDTSELRLGR
jgi:transcriptional regulator with XRE-family HTH domain